jgi:hypothetical protein
MNKLTYTNLPPANDFGAQLDSRNTALDHRNAHLDSHQVRARAARQSGSAKAYVSQATAHYNGRAELAQRLESPSSRHHRMVLLLKFPSSLLNLTNNKRRASHQQRPLWDLGHHLSAAPHPPYKSQVVTVGAFHETIPSVEIPREHH